MDELVYELQQLKNKKVISKTIEELKEMENE